MLLQEIADYAVRERSSTLSDDVAHHTKRAVVDWFAAMLPGSVRPPATLLREALAEELDRGRAHLYGAERRATLRAAALINGAAAHTVELDDIFRDAIFHPGAPTVAAALAAAQSEGADGLTFLRAVVIGYEISTRIALAMGPSHYNYWHMTATIGPFGAAAAAATILDLSRDQVMHALATVGTFAAGLQQAFRSDAMSKPLHAGRAAEGGALAALGAAKGVTGALDILEGGAGLGRAMSDNADWGKAVEGLGGRYNITRMTFKNHGCCGHAFAAIDGALALSSAHELTPELIRRICVGTYHAAVQVTGNSRPVTDHEARFSLAYVVCHALVHGSVRLDAFDEKRLDDPAIRGLMQRLELAVDPELDAAFPGRRAANVEIETTDGRILRHHQPTRKGDPEAPLSDAELNDKYLELAAPVIGHVAAHALLDKLWSLETLKAVDLVPGTMPQVGRGAAE